MDVIEHVDKRMSDIPFQILSRMIYEQIKMPVPNSHHDLIASKQCDNLKKERMNEWTNNNEWKGEWMKNEWERIKNWMIINNGKVNERKNDRVYMKKWTNEWEWKENGWTNEWTNMCKRLYEW